MLILSRKTDESVVIGDNIIVKIVDIDRGSVKLGFEAPPKTLILREELRRAISDQNKKASSINIESSEISSFSKNFAKSSK